MKSPTSLPKLLTRHITEVIGESPLIHHFQQFPHLYKPENEIPWQSLPPSAAELSPLSAKNISSQKPLSLYWGTATTSTPHFGYYLPLLKIRDFLQLQVNVTILLADIHAALDKIEFQQMEHTRLYYEYILKQMLERIHVDYDALMKEQEESPGMTPGRLSFKTGSEFQLTPKYSMDVYRMSHVSTIDSARGASAMVVKQTENPVMSSIMYPILQALDEEYLDVDLQFGGVDQRKIFMFARENLPRIGYRKRSYLMNPLIPALSKDGKMSSSDASSKIDFLNTDDEIYKKIKKAYSLDGQAEDNGLLAILQYIIFPVLEIERVPLLIKRPQKFGGDMKFTAYKQLEDAFIKREVVSTDLKENITREIISLISPVRSGLQKNIHLYNRAYGGNSQQDANKSKKEKQKNKGGIFKLYIDQQVKLLKEQQHPDLTEEDILKQNLTQIKSQFKNLSSEEKKALLEQV